MVGCPTWAMRPGRCPRPGGWCGECGRDDDRGPFAQLNADPEGMSCLPPFLAGRATRCQPASRTLRARWLPPVGPRGPSQRLVRGLHRPVYARLSGAFSPQRSRWAGLWLAPVASASWHRGGPPRAALRLRGGRARRRGVVHDAAQPAVGGGDAASGPCPTTRPTIASTRGSRSATGCARTCGTDAARWRSRVDGEGERYTTSIRCQHRGMPALGPRRSPWSSQDWSSPSRSPFS